MQFDRMWRKEKQSKTLCMTSYWKQNMIKSLITIKVERRELKEGW